MQIDYHYDGSSGQRTLPKDGEARTNYLFSESEERECPDAISGVRLFERWTELVGVQPGDAPIFSAPRGGRLNGQYVSKLVNEARRKAGIPDVGEGGRKRKPIHALRSSYTRIAREAGFPTWLIQHNLGHSTPLLTENVYGRISGNACARPRAAKPSLPDAACSYQWRVAFPRWQRLRWFGQERRRDAAASRGGSGRASV